MNLIKDRYGMDIHPDVLGEETMVLSEDDLTLDWGAKSLGIDLGFGYRVKRIILKPTSTTTRVGEDTLQVFASLYNLEDYYTESVSFTYEKDDTTGTITILFDTLQFARFIKIHSHFYEMDETGASLYNESTMTLEKTDPFDVFILSSGRNEFYTYDPWMHGRAASLLATRPKGNREKLSYFTTSFTSYDYSYYTGSDLIKTDGKYGYKYDANGNMLEKGSVYTELGDNLIITKEDEYFRYEYDLLNRLKNVYSLDEVTGNEVFIKSYIYNAAGMRITAENSEGIKTQYTFDTGGKVVEKEVDGVIRNFFYLGSKVIAHKEAGETLYYGTDHLGSSVLMTDATGQAVWTGAVTPFADSETTEGLSEHVMFTGKELDTDTGLYYYNARWYDPNLGRFITEDPIRDGPNWYAYVSNDPINKIDPDGLDDLFVTYNGQKEELRTVYVPRTASGGIDETKISTNVFSATNNVNESRTSPVDSNGNTIMTTPVNGDEKPYIPQKIPEGTFNITGTAKSSGIFGPVKIKTDAQPVVQTYKEVEDLEGNTTWQKDSNQRDYGYWIHSGNTDINAYTRGCIRVSEGDSLSIADMVNQALGSVSGTANLNVIKNK